MSDQADRLIPLLQASGLCVDESRLYSFILINQEVSVLDLHRALEIPRTRVYRLLDKLIRKRLVVELLNSRGKRFAVSSPEQFEQNILNKKFEIDKKIGLIPDLLSEIQFVKNSPKRTKSQIYYYPGIDGLRQVTWNSTKTKELRIIELKESMNEWLDQDYAEKVRRESVLHDTKTYQLTNSTHIRSYTNISEMMKLWEVRYIDPAKLKLDFEVLIYDDVVAMYRYLDEEIFCIEIHNKYLAAMQKQIFDLLWSQSERMKKVGKHGEAILEKPIKLRDK